MNYLLAFLLSTVTVGLKGFQHKNVLGNHYKLVAVTSLFMALGNVLVVGLWAHNRFVKPRTG